MHTKLYRLYSFKEVFSSIQKKKLSLNSISKELCCLVIQNMVPKPPGSLLEGLTLQSCRCRP